MRGRRGAGSPGPVWGSRAAAAEATPATPAGKRTAMAEAAPAPVRVTRQSGGSLGPWGSPGRREGHRQRRRTGATGHVACRPGLRRQPGTGRGGRSGCDGRTRHGTPRVSARPVPLASRCEAAQVQGCSREGPPTRQLPKRGSEVGAGVVIRQPFPRLSPNLWPARAGAAGTLGLACWGVDDPCRAGLSVLRAPCGDRAATRSLPSSRNERTWKYPWDLPPRRTPRRPQGTAILKVGSPRAPRGVRGEARTEWRRPGRKMPSPSLGLFCIFVFKRC